MSEVSKYEAQKKKMDGLCEEHDLNYRFRKESYPITLSVSPIQGVGVQMSMLDETDGGDYISPGASLTLIFADGELTSKVSGGTFTISKTLRTKIENIFLKMCAFWQQYFFRDVMQNGSLRKGTMPVIDEDDADDTDEPIEDDEEETAEDQPEETAAEDAGDEPDGEDDDNLPPDEDVPDDGEDPDEDTITAATLLVRMENKASVRLLQRRLKLGAAKASRIMDELEKRGVVGPYQGGQPREVLPVDAPES